MSPITDTHFWLYIPSPLQVAALMPAQLSPHSAVLMLEGWNAEEPKLHHCSLNFLLLSP